MDLTHFGISTVCRKQSTSFPMPLFLSHLPSARRSTYQENRCHVLMCAKQRLITSPNKHLSSPHRSPLTQQFLWVHLHTRALSLSISALRPKIGHLRRQPPLNHCFYMHQFLCTQIDHFVLTLFIWHSAF